MSTERTAMFSSRLIFLSALSFRASSERIPYISSVRMSFTVDRSRLAQAPCTRKNTSMQASVNAFSSNPASIWRTWEIPRSTSLLSAAGLPTGGV